MHNNYLRVLGRYYVFFDDREPDTRAAAWQSALEMLRRYSRKAPDYTRDLCIFRGSAIDDMGDAVSHRLAPISERVPVIGTARALVFTERSELS